MDKNIKSDINFLANRAKTVTNYAKQITSPIADIAEDFHSHLPDLKYLQCLQELSRVSQFKENAVNFINDVSKQTLEMIVIQGETQVYILQSKTDHEVLYLLKNRQSEIAQMKNFASTKQLPDGLEQPSFGVYDAFMGMVDSLSVYPTDNFNTNWKRLVDFYNKGNPCEKNPSSTCTPTPTSLLSCFCKIVEWGKEK
jgi:hypothetical protein